MWLILWLGVRRREVVVDVDLFRLDSLSVATALDLRGGSGSLSSSSICWGCSFKKASLLLSWMEESTEF
jgi:hypothetical protein